MQRVCWRTLAEQAGARSRSSSRNGFRLREKATQDVHSTGSSGLAVALDSALTKLGEVGKSFRQVGTVEDVTLEGIESVLGIPWRLGRG